MDYFISFLEGIITFVSPCMLPMLPVYITYFTGQTGAEGGRGALRGALGFVLGFTVVFTILGGAAGAMGGFLWTHQRLIRSITGGMVILFGLGYLGVLPIAFFRGGRRMGAAGAGGGFWRSVLFGVVFSVGWTPCVGAFLGSALMSAASGGDSLRGVVMLVLYSAGLGIPFVASALLLDRLRGAFDFIKKNYRTVNLLSGSILILAGILIMTGLLF